METATATKLELALPPLAGGDAFDYEAPEHVEHYTRLTLARDAIRKEMGRCAKSIITIGLHLIDVKKDCGHGLFLKWLAAEFGWSDQTARNFMHVAKVFGNEANSKRILNLEPTTLYLLAAPKTPEQVREEVLSRFDAGKKLQAEEVKKLIREAKGGPSKHKPPEPPRPVIKKPEEEDDHELKGWVATFESWSIDRQKLGLTLLDVEEEEDRELLALVDIRGEMIAQLKRENQLLREQLAATQPEPTSESEEAPRPTSEPKAAEPPAEQIEQPVAPVAPTPVAPATPTPPQPTKSREETIAAFERSGRLGLNDWQQRRMHIDAVVVKALIAEGLLAAERDDRVRIIQPWMSAA